MKRGIQLLSVCLVLLLSVLMLPVAVFAEQDGAETFASMPRPDRHAGSDLATVEQYSLEEYVDLEVFGDYLYEQLKNCATKIDISAYNIPRQASMVTEMTYYVIRNIPEAFHFDYFSSYYYRDGIVTELVPTYLSFSDTAEEYKTCFDQFSAVAESLLHNIKGNTWLTDVEKALLLHDRLIVWTEYDEANYEAGTVPDISYTAYGILVKQIGVCQGYALAYDYLLEQVGIRSEYVSSDLLNHAWNIVYINNNPYHVDTTWDDPVWDITGRVEHTNFLRSTNGIVETGHYRDGYIDFTSAPVDTTYDSYYWQNSETAFQLVGDRIYYIDNAAQTVNYLDNGTTKTLFSIDSIWRASSNSVWRGNYARLSSDSTSLLFSKPDGIYRYNPSGGTVDKIYSPDLSIGSYYAVYGFKYEHGYLICDLSNTPNFTQYTKNDQVKYLYDNKVCIHSFTNYVSDGNATCTADGTKTAKCDRCDARDTQTDVGSKLDHSFTNYISNNDATCTADGTKTAKCDRCEETKTVTDEGTKLNHSFTNYISNNDATCIADGTKTAKCDRCDARDTQTDVGSKLDHSFTEYKSNNDATCTADGTKTAKCDRCEETKTVADEGTKLNHSFTEYKSNNDATCTTDGTKTAKCDRCDARDTQTDAGSKLDHSFTEYKSNNDATCTTDGTKTAKCDRCEETKTVADDGTKLNHSFTNYISNNDATYEADGTKTAKCDRCEETDTVTDPGTKLQQINGWVSEGGRWYYYKAGIKATGWLQDGAYWYYFNGSGIMQTGWQKISNVWYYFRSGGKMATGWLQDGGYWYYFQGSGAMKTGWLQLGSTWYYFQGGGKMATGWMQDGGYWYYFQSSGAMKTGWLQLGSTWYYFHGGGKMATGWLQDGGYWYYFQSSGAMKTGWQQLGNTWYYFHPGGKMATGAVTVGGKTYQFAASGAWIP